METASKICARCLRELPLTAYMKMRTAPDGLKYQCRECDYAYMAEWRAANRDRIREYTKKYKQSRTPEQVAHKNAHDLERYHADPTVARDKLLRRKYGIGLVEYNALFEVQDGLCAICGDPAGERTMHVDHHHDTGVVRGLLCTRCNTGLGQFRDNPDFLTRAIAYLLNT